MFGHLNHVHVVKIFLNVKQEYKSALRYTNRLLQIEPQNRQGIELQEKITAQMKKGQSNCIHPFVGEKSGLETTKVSPSMKKMFIRLNGNNSILISTKQNNSRCLDAGWHIISL